MRKLLTIFVLIYKSLKRWLFPGSIKKRPRRYISARMGVERFFEKLEKEEIRYSVLRWYDDLPYVAPGEDIDILVHDDDIDKLDACLNGTKRNGTPCDIYTCGGLPGTNHRTVSYFPVTNAFDLIEHRKITEKGIAVPSPEYAFYSMAYHVVYHKGYESSLPTTLNDSLVGSPCDHDYIQVLNGLAHKAEISLPYISLEKLDDFLDSHGWRPQNDTLKKLSKRNEWIQDRFFSKVEKIPEELWGMTVYIIREEGLQYLDVIRKTLWDDGFEILHEGPIEGQIFDEAKLKIRGANWNKGPFPFSGGDPRFAIIVFDCFPMKPDKTLKEQHPGISNGRILKTKINIRNKINEMRPSEIHCNVMHSADSAVEAMEYAKVVFPDLDWKPLIEKCRDIVTEFHSPYPVLEDLSQKSRRSKIELIDFHGEKAVCKTYRPGREIFLQREIKARELDSDNKFTTRILESGKNYFIQEYIPDDQRILYTGKPLFAQKSLYPVWLLRNLAECILFYRKQGYELIDFTPGNILICSDKTIKIIDFEFLYKANKELASLDGNYAWFFPPLSFAGDLPSHLVKRKIDPYKRRWERYFGISRRSAIKVLKMPLSLLKIEQFFYVLYKSLRNIGKEVYYLPRNSIRKLKKYYYGR